MSSVWGVALAAVRRRRVQSAVLAVVVLCSTVALVVALGLLEASTEPFDRTFAEQRGPHVAVSFDRREVPGERLAGTAERPGVEAAAGPFGKVVVTIPDDVDQALGPGPLTVVGRPDPGRAPVDRVDLWAGRWPARSGEVVISRPPEPYFRVMIGQWIQPRGGPRLTIVGVASSVSKTAEAWVTPDQVQALNPTTSQMLYRFTRAGTDGDLQAAVTAATAGLPAALDMRTYLDVKRDVTRTASAYLPFLTGFGFLGVLVAVVIVGNVTSGAVIAGQRHIGVLKSIGFTPNQIIGIYLTMVLIPGLAGCLAGTALGGLAAQPVVDMVFRGVGAIVGAGVSARVYAAALAGVPVLIAVAALVPASRAHRMSAARAINTGSAPGRGHARRIQRALAGLRLPRPVTLGLGLPFARPGRSALTLVVIVAGVAAVTLASGLIRTMTAYGDTAQRVGKVHSVVHVGSNDQVQPKLDDAGIEALLRSMPGVRYVTADAWIDLHLAGSSDRVMAQFLRGDAATRGDLVVAGRYLSSSPGEVVAPSAFLEKYGLRVGDRLTLLLGDGTARATIVGEAFDATNNLIMVSWPTLAALGSDEKATQYDVRLAPGYDVEQFNAAVKAADPGLYPITHSQVNVDSATIIGAALAFTLLLGAVATLGVFNTVVLNTRERRRDLAMLKSIGMTPRQVTAMTVTSMAALGALGGAAGLPIGIVSHEAIVRTMVEAADLALPAFMLDVWDGPGPAALALAGVAIAALGAFVPARSAASLTIADALHTE